MTHTMRAVDSIMTKAGSAASELMHAEVKSILARMLEKHNVKIYNIIMRNDVWTFSVDDPQGREWYHLEALLTTSEDESLGGLMGMFIVILEYLGEKEHMTLLPKRFG